MNDLNISRKFCFFQSGYQSIYKIIEKALKKKKKKKHVVLN